MKAKSTVGGRAPPDPIGDGGQGADALGETKDKGEGVQDVGLQSGVHELDHLREIDVGPCECRTDQEAAGCLDEPTLEVGQVARPRLVHGGRIVDARDLVEQLTELCSIHVDVGRVQIVAPVNVELLAQILGCLRRRVNRLLKSLSRKEVHVVVV